MSWKSINLGNIQPKLPISGTIIYGKLSMSEQQQHFTSKFQAYTSPCKHTFKEVRGAHVVQVGSQDVIGPLTVVEQEGVQINMSMTQYNNLCSMLYRMHEEEVARMSDPEVFNLWMRYRTYMELKR